MVFWRELGRDAVRYQVHVQHISGVMLFTFEKIFTYIYIYMQLCHMPPERMGESQVRRKILPILSMQGPTSRKKGDLSLSPN